MQRVYPLCCSSGWYYVVLDKTRWLFFIYKIHISTQWSSDYRYVFAVIISCFPCSRVVQNERGRPSGTYRERLQRKWRDTVQSEINNPIRRQQRSACYLSFLQSSREPCSSNKLSIRKWSQVYLVARNTIFWMLLYGHGSNASLPLLSDGKLGLQGTWSETLLTFLLEYELFLDVRLCESKYIHAKHI